MRLEQIYRELAEKCLDEKVPIDAEPNGAIHRWIAANVEHRLETAFFIVVGIAGEMADLEAQREGYKNQFDKEAKLAFERHGRKEGKQ